VYDWLLSIGAFGTGWNWAAAVPARPLRRPANIAAHVVAFFGPMMLSP
jgi:hypothetical protein